jgi:arabinoxylan arabinofuranohydrolase
MNAVKRFLHRKTIAAQLLCAVTLIPSASIADNPIVQTIYTADPAPLVHDGRLYVYTGHDEDRSTYFTMNEWRVYSTVDMVNWTDHGSPLRYNTFNWSKGDAWAGQAIHRNGKFYFYVPTKSRSLDRMSIGVAMSDSPTGPFSDPIGRPLVANSWEDIDPTAFIDDDGQAYLYWGNPNLWYVKLNEDMISYQGGVVKGPMTTASFGSRTGNGDRPTLYEEGPWFYKRNDLYYLVFAAGGIPEYLAYSTSPGPTGPWTYKGTIMPTEGGSFTNHPGVVDYKGNSYLFYHNGALPGGGGFTRSVCVEQFTYNANGTFPTIKMTSAGPPAIANLNPYLATEAETIAWESGVETEVCSEGGMDVTAIENGDYIKVKGVDFGPGAVSFDARVASASNGGNIELRLDSPSGTLVGTCTVQGTGGWQKWVTRSCPVSGATGLHDLYLRFTGGSGSLLNLNWWKFDSGGADAGVADAGVADAGVADAGVADAGVADAGARDASAADAAAVDGGASDAKAGTADGSESVGGCGCGLRGAPIGGNIAGLALVSFLAALLHRRGGTGSSEQRAR